VSFAENVFMMAIGKINISWGSFWEGTALLLVRNVVAEEIGPPVPYLRLRGL